MHKARSLANVYFWNRYFEDKEKPEYFEMFCPKEWALPIIGEEEYNFLFDMVQKRKDAGYTIHNNLVDDAD